MWEEYWYDYLGKIGYFGKIIEKETTKLADINIAVSNTTYQNLKKLNVNNIVAIPNGIDIDRIKSISTPNKYYDMIYAGRFTKEKNLSILIKSVDIIKEYIPDIKCCLIGDGPEKEIIKKYIRKLNLENNISLRRFLNYNGMIYYLKASKVFVTPSTREGFGITAVEANACGLPVITVNNKKNAIKDLIIEGKNGFLCNFSEHSLANKTLLALDKFNKMKKFCSNIAKKYDWKNITTKYINEILNNSY